MTRAIDLKDRKFGRLKVIQRIVNDRFRKAQWICHCDCGEETTVNAGKLISGHTKSCGCLQKEAARKNLTTHGMSYKKEYQVWRDMINRCCNPNATGYQNYGGRGIEVCDRWLTSVRDFLDDMGPKPAGGYTIERMDNEGNYDPCNCKWATWSEQAQNKRLHPKNITGVTGVTKYNNGKYRARIYRNKKQYSLGYFDTVEEAIKARKKAEIRLLDYEKS